MFNHDDPVYAQRIVKACYNAGLRAFEWTNRGENAMEAFTVIREYCKVECQGMRLGVGSILDVSTADHYMSKGAEFIVSPVFDPELARFAKDAKFSLIPGCGSVTEIHQAQKYGAKLVKIFPGNVLGPEFVKAVLGPMPWTEIMPTGGVSPDRENLLSWFKAGVKCVGMGSKLFRMDLESQEDFDSLENQIREVLSYIKEIRKSSGSL